MVVNEDRFFLTHRLPIALEAKRNGWHVTVMTCDHGNMDKIRRHGIEAIPLPIDPTRPDIRRDWQGIRMLTDYYREHLGAVVHHVGIKMIMVGGVAARRAGRTQVINAVCGLGTLFARTSVVSVAAAAMLRFILKGLHLHTIFQNHDDFDFFRSHNIPTGEPLFIRGSGIDLNEFAPAPEETAVTRSDIRPDTGTPDKAGSTAVNPKLQVIFTGRLLREKGVEDFCAAARMLRPEMEGRVRFVICGGISRNPKALKRSDMEHLADGRYIDWVGFRDDVRPLLRRSDIMVFPSFYREGLPKSVIEASAVGLPVITTDSVGCRDTVDEGVNGFIVPPHRPDMIADRLRRLVNDEDLRRRMGRASRLKAEKEYDVRDVVATHLGVYDEVLKILSPE